MSIYWLGTQIMKVNIRGSATYRNYIHFPSKWNSLVCTYVLIAIHLKSLSSPVYQMLFWKHIDLKQWISLLLTHQLGYIFQLLSIYMNPFFSLQTTQDRKSLPCIETSPALISANFLFSTMEGSWDHWSRSDWILQVLLKWKSLCKSGQWRPPGSLFTLHPQWIDSQWGLWTDTQWGLKKFWILCYRFVCVCVCVLRSI